MKFACERCGKRFASVDEPVAGRVYRIRCRCGNVIRISAPQGRAAAGKPQAAPAPVDRVPAARGSVPEHVHATPLSALVAPGTHDPSEPARDTPAAPPRDAPAAPALDPFQAAVDLAGAAPPPDPPRIDEGPAPSAPASPAIPPPVRDPDPFAGTAAAARSEETAPVEPPDSAPAAEPPAPVQRAPALEHDTSVELSVSEKSALSSSRRSRRRVSPGAIAAGIVAVAVVVTAVALFWPQEARDRTPRVPVPTAPPVLAPTAPPLAAPEPSASPPAAEPSPPPRGNAPAAPARPEKPRAARPLEPAPAERKIAAAPPAAADAPPPPPTPSTEPATRPPADAAAAPAPAPEGQGLDPAVLQSIIARSRPALDGCVERALQDPATASHAGRKAALLILVSPSGKAEGALEDGDLDASPFGACVRRAARTMAFPPFKGEEVRARVVLQLGPAN